MKIILPFLLFFPLLLLSIYFGFTQSQIKKEVKIINTTSPVSITPIAINNVTSIPTSQDIVPTQINLELISPQSGSTVESSSIEVYGKTNKTVNVAINDQELISSNDGTFKTTVLLDEGENYISIIAYDEQGNVAEREIIVIRTTSGI